MRLFELQINRGRKAVLFDKRMMQAGTVAMNTKLSYFVGILTQPK